MINRSNIWFILTIVFFSLIYFMQAYMYSSYIPNGYAWKDLMIKWTDGELIRRGLLGSVFYSLEPLIPLKYAAISFFYICYIFPISVIYKKLIKLKLPIWILIALLFSPSLFLFNLHDTLVLKKDIVVIFGVSLSLLMVDLFFKNSDKCYNAKIAFFTFVYISLYIFFILCYELFVFFVPLILLYLFINLLKIYTLRKSLIITSALGTISLLLFVILVIPYIGNLENVKRIVIDWSKYYPDLRIFLGALYEFQAPSDPFTFIIMPIDRYKEYFMYIYGNTKLMDLFLIYILEMLPIIVITSLGYVKLKEQKSFLKMYLPALILVIHIPLLISFVAFDFGRWIVFSFYAAIFVLCYFTEENITRKFSSILNYSIVKVLFFLIAIVYILLWQPLHWVPVPSESLIQFNWPGLDLLFNTIDFYSNVLNSK